ncbi:hypothetical protein [Anaerosolibacter sp.]|uniref:hypothetical protein n=1 Tax=Anaerosolibacter sp. TaxID=1872527 RepID=UPI0039EFA80D
MPWYDWIATYALILGAFVWSVIPEKSLFFTLCTLGPAVGGFVFLRYFSKDIEKKIALKKKSLE